MFEPSTDMDRMLLGNTRELKEIRVSSLFLFNSSNFEQLKSKRKEENLVDCSALNTKKIKLNLLGKGEKKNL